MTSSLRDFALTNSWQSISLIAFIDCFVVALPLPRNDEMVWQSTLSLWIAAQVLRLARNDDSRLGGYVNP